MAEVKRARFAFTTVYLIRRTHQVRRPGGLGSMAEIPGFASPSRGGFALDRPRARNQLFLTRTVAGRSEDDP